ncbi:hypothetical protein ACFSC6_15335 [Rufibacter sediminis]|uniref:YopX protein domain-containing protein n=1 Tax=Rufibacter sediminis TaxID=2762756 RepID=A0ABR6VW78_9BACT|nr:hypothetical protein [Rufibacter sediminis]MBC3541408.1 hypothetical protein [Rufibacter sediminis]
MNLIQPQLRVFGLDNRFPVDNEPYYFTICTIDGLTPGKSQAIFFHRDDFSRVSYETHNNLDEDFLKEYYDAGGCIEYEASGFEFKDFVIVENIDGVDLYVGDEYALFRNLGSEPIKRGEYREPPRGRDMDTGWGG